MRGGLANATRSRAITEALPLIRPLSLIHIFNAWGLGSDDLDNGVLLLLAPNEADGGDYYIMRGDGLESQLSFSTLRCV